MNTELYKALEKLIQWADRYDIPEFQYSEVELDDDGSVLRNGYWFGLPRDKSKLYELEELNLNGFMKSDIPDELRYLKKLKRLSLADGPIAQWDIEDVGHDLDCIREIPSWISELENLEFLNLSGNSISHVPSYLVGLTKLKELILSCNRIEFVTKEIGQLQQLEVLWLGANRTGLLTDGIRSLGNLKELWLDGLPGSIYGPVTLKQGAVVVCTSKGHSTIPVDATPKNVFEALTYIEQLAQAEWINDLYAWADENNVPDLQLVHDDEYFDDNGKPIFEPFWIGLPRDRFELLGLEELDLSWHSFTKIPEEIRRLTNLKKLVIAKRRDGFQPPFYENARGDEAIEEIPDWIGELGALEVLNLYGNNILYIPKAVGKIKNLKELKLNGNPIIFVEHDIITLPKLETLWLKGSKFSILDDCIDFLVKGAYLTLEESPSNKISILKNCLEQIERLDLADERYFDFNYDFAEEVEEKRFKWFSKGLSKARQIAKSGNHDLIWNVWHDLSNIRAVVNALPHLKEVWCDGLVNHKHWPLTLCEDGIKTRVVKELDYDHAVILRTEDIYEDIVLRCESEGLTLGEKIAELKLWDVE